MAATPRDGGVGGPDPGSARRPVAVFADIEGCLAPGKGREWNVGGLARLAAWIADRPGVRFAIASGRPVPYVEAMAQALGLHRSTTPCVCEGGAVLYVPATDRVEQLAPTLERSELLDAVAAIPHRIEVGKLSCLTIYPEASDESGIAAGIERLHAAITARVQTDRYSIVCSAAAVDITPAGYDKASGVAAACARIGLPLDSVLCIGDAGNDLPMLRSAGFSACPANASIAVRRVVDVSAGAADIDGVLAILATLF